jgi:hypothetical protein
MGFLFAFLIIAPIVVGIFVALVRPWLWTGSFLAGFLGLFLVIFPLTWIFGAPSESAGDTLRQGNSVGPWLGLVAGLIVLAAGIVDGVFRLLAFLAVWKAGSARQV